MKKLMSLSIIIFLAYPLKLISQDAKNKESGINLIKNVYTTEGIEAAKKTYENIKEDENFDFILDEFCAFGEELLNNRKYKDAVAVFKMGNEKFPKSNDILTNLATSYYKAGNHIKSQETQKKLTELFNEKLLDDYKLKNKDAILDNAEDIIRKHIEAIGGIESWNSIETMMITFEVQPEDESNLEIVRMYKRPYFFRQEAKGTNSFNSTDGTKNWSFNGSEWIENQVHYRVASIDNYMTNYLEQGICYRYIALTILNHTPVYQIERVFNDGFKQDLYFSAETFLLQEIKSVYIENYPFMESFFSFWDYQEIEGIKIPFVQIRNVGLIGPPHGLVIKKVLINIPMENSMFVPLGEK